MMSIYSARLHCKLDPPAFHVPWQVASYPAHTEQNVMWPPVSCQLIGRLQGRIVVCLLFEYLPTLPIIKVSCNKLTSCAVFTEKEKKSVCCICRIECFFK